MAHANCKTEIVRGVTLASQPWWQPLHTMINDAFQHKRHSVYPPSWLRLNAESSRAAEGLSNELGPNGYFAVGLSEEDKPLACGGVLPYRGDAWINAVSAESPEARAKAAQHVRQINVEPSKDPIPAWEICCFSTHPSHRGEGLSRHILHFLIDFVKSKGAERLYCNHAMDETGAFWSKLGFVIVEGADSMLPKGFKVDPEKEGLRDDIHYRTGVMMLS